MGIDELEDDDSAILGAAEGERVDRKVQDNGWMVQEGK